MPVNKRYGDAIIGGTLNEGESFDMIVTVKDQDTMMSKLCDRLMKRKISFLKPNQRLAN